MPPRSRFALEPQQLTRQTDPQQLGIADTSEIASKNTIYGQKRGVEAIEFGIDIGMSGYNLFVLGPTGSGRLTAVHHFIHERASDDPTPDDWWYVYNFRLPQSPTAIRLPAGRGREFKADIDGLIAALRRDISRALESNLYLQARSKIRHQLEQASQAEFAKVERMAAERSFTIQTSQQGFIALIPVRDGQPMAQEVLQALPQAEVDQLNAARQELEQALDDVMRSTRNLRTQAEAAVERLQRDLAHEVLIAHLGPLNEKYSGNARVLSYLSDLRENILEELAAFQSANSSDDSADDEGTMTARSNSEDIGNRFAVNVLVERQPNSGAPVALLDLPTYQNLVGRIEHEVRFGMLSTDFTLIKSGALHRANGGFLIIRAQDILQQPFAWEALKRALTNHQVVIQDPDTGGASVMATKQLEPEPIPLKLKVVLVGDPALYYTLINLDDSFSELFRVKADFSDTMARTPENENLYAEFIATRAHEENLRHFTAEAVARVIDYGSWLVADQDKLSTQFGAIASIIYESDFFAGRSGRERVQARDVEQALTARRFRSNQPEELSQERIERGAIFIDVAGKVVGQVNGLVVMGLGDYPFGLPSRITARVYMGRRDVVQIDRESSLSGPIHDKGVLILQGYLGGRYALDYPLTLSASITFEQSYGGVEGDSASSAELFALMSALANLPIRQDIAVTGSVNQLGQIQPIGGVTQKIEGFFQICQQRGLTSAQGVIIPRANLSNLMLNDDVIAAVRAGNFHVYAVETVDEAISLLTGKSAKAVHAAVDARLRYLAERLAAFEEHPPQL